MSDTSLQQGIDSAGSPMRLLWKVDPPEFEVPVVPPEYIGWEAEQSAWRDRPVLFDQCHHMFSLFLSGPDARRLLAHSCVNDLDNFVVGQAKQMVTVTPAGHLITDVILFRAGENEYVMTGVPSAMNWVSYHAQRGGYDVDLEFEPAAGSRPAGVPPRLFRYQVQGAQAIEVIERAIGGPAPQVKFFHSVEAKIGGRPLRLFRHGMLGQPGFEILGDWQDHDAVIAALLEAGQPSRMQQIGGKAYFLNAVESGWIPTPTPGIYTDPALADYRRFLPLHSFEGMMPIHGSYFSPDIEDYYITPYDIGYGKMIRFDRDFIGRAALERHRDQVAKQRVTLVFDPDDVRTVLGDNPGYINRHARDRVEIGGELVGVAMHGNYLPYHGTFFTLALVDKAHAAVGTQMDVAWGEHPGPEAPIDAHRAFPRIRARVEASPYDSYARTEYRKAG